MSTMRLSEAIRLGAMRTGQAVGGLRGEITYRGATPESIAKAKQACAAERAAITEATNGAVQFTEDGAIVRQQGDGYTEIAPALETAQQRNAALWHAAETTFQALSVYGQRGESLVSQSYAVRARYLSDADLVIRAYERALAGEVPDLDAKLSAYVWHVNETKGERA